MLRTSDDCKMAEGTGFSAAITTLGDIQVGDSGCERVCVVSTVQEATSSLLALFYESYS